MTSIDGERALALAVLERAALDVAGRRVSTGRSKLRGEREAQAGAVEWAEEAGDDFRFWCDVAGVEPDRARRALLAVEGEALSGRRTADLHATGVLGPGRAGS